MNDDPTLDNGTLDKGAETENKFSLEEELRVIDLLEADRDYFSEKHRQEKILRRKSEDDRERAVRVKNRLQDNLNERISRNSALSRENRSLRDGIERLGKSIRLVKDALESDRKKSIYSGVKTEGKGFTVQDLRSEIAEFVDKAYDKIKTRDESIAAITTENEGLKTEKTNFETEVNRLNKEIEEYRSSGSSEIIEDARIQRNRLKLLVEEVKKKFPELPESDAENKEREYVGKFGEGAVAEQGGTPYTGLGKLLRWRKSSPSKIVESGGKRKKNYLSTSVDLVEESVSSLLGYLDKLAFAYEWSLKDMDHTKDSLILTRTLYEEEKDLMDKLDEKMMGYGGMITSLIESAEILEGLIDSYSDWIQDVDGEADDVESDNESNGLVAEEISEDDSEDRLAALPGTLERIGEKLESLNELYETLENDVETADEDESDYEDSLDEFEGDTAPSMPKFEDFVPEDNLGKIIKDNYYMYLAGEDHEEESAQTPTDTYEENGYIYRDLLLLCDVSKEEGVNYIYDELVDSNFLERNLLTWWAEQEEKNSDWYSKLIGFFGFAKDERPVKVYEWLLSPLEEGELSPIIQKLDPSDLTPIDENEEKDKQVGDKLTGKMQTVEDKQTVDPVSSDQQEFKERPADSEVVDASENDSPDLFGIPFYSHHANGASEVTTDMSSEELRPAEMDSVRKWYWNWRFGLGAAAILSVLGGAVLVHYATDATNNSPDLLGVQSDLQGGDQGNQKKDEKSKRIIKSKGEDEKARKAKETKLVGNPPTERDIVAGGKIKKLAEEADGKDLLLKVTEIDDLASGSYLSENLVNQTIDPSILTGEADSKPPEIVKLDCKHWYPYDPVSRSLDKKAKICSLEVNDASGIEKCVIRNTKKKGRTYTVNGLNKKVLRHEFGFANICKNKDLCRPNLVATCTDSKGNKTKVPYENRFSDAIYPELWIDIPGSRRGSTKRVCIPWEEHKFKMNVVFRAKPVSDARVILTPKANEYSWRRNRVIGTCPEKETKLVAKAEYKGFSRTRYFIVSPKVEEENPENGVPETDEIFIR